MVERKLIVILLIHLECQDKKNLLRKIQLMICISFTYVSKDNIKCGNNTTDSLIRMMLTNARG